MEDSAYTIKLAFKSLQYLNEDIQYLNEGINFELKIDDKLCTFAALYRSPRQSQDNFETFIDNFELNLETLSRKNPFLLVAIGDFNAK